MPLTHPATDGRTRFRLTRGALVGRAAKVGAASRADLVRLAATLAPTGQVGENGGAVPMCRRPAAVRLATHLEVVTAITVIFECPNDTLAQLDKASELSEALSHQPQRRFHLAYETIDASGERRN